MPWESDGCDPQVAALLKRWLTLGSFALMTAERLAAVSLSLTHNNLDVVAQTASEAQAVRDVLHQISVQRAFAIALVQMAATHTEQFRELADEFNRDFAEVVNEFTHSAHQLS